MKRTLGLTVRRLAMLIVIGATMLALGRAQVFAQMQMPQPVMPESPVVIEPAVADTCYLPVYDPWVVYGAPISVYPGYFYDPWYGGPYITFDRGIHVGFLGWGYYGYRGGFRTGPRFRSGFRSFGGGHAIRGFGGRSFGGRSFRGGGFRGRGFGGRGFGGFGHHR